MKYGVASLILSPPQQLSLLTVQLHFRTVLASIPNCSGLNPKLFWPHSQAVLASFPNCSGLIPRLFWPQSQTVLASFPNCSGLIPRLFWPQSQTSGLIPCSSPPSQLLLLTIYTITYCRFWYDSTLLVLEVMIAVMEDWEQGYVVVMCTIHSSGIPSLSP